MQLDTATKFSRTTIILHWVVGLTMIGLLTIGVYMTENNAYAFYPWHKSFGVLIFSIALIRAIWRIKNGWPTPTGQYQHFQHLIAKIVHYTLIIATLLMPISGFIMSALGGHGVSVFGFELVAHNPDPLNPSKVIPHNGSLASLGHTIHHWLGYIMIAAVLLHIAGALKHHLIDKDGTLKRMLGRKI